MEDSSTSSSIKDEAKVVAEVARTFDITLKEKQLEAIISFLKGLYNTSNWIWKVYNIWSFTICF